MARAASANRQGRRVASDPPKGPKPDLEHWTGRTLEDLAAECDAIRAQRGLPDVILHALLDDMPVYAERARTMTCDTRRKYGIKGRCVQGCRSCQPTATSKEMQQVSYSFTVPAGPKSDLNERLAFAWSQEAGRLRNVTPEPPLREMTDQVTAVAEAVRVLARAVGLAEDQLSMTISGHANPGHAQTEGWGDEYCQLSVSVRRPTT